MIDYFNEWPGVRTARWMDGTDKEKNLAIIEKMQGKVIIGVWGESDSADSDEVAYEKGTKLADKYMKDYPKHPVYYCDLFDIHPKYREATYVESRKIAGGQK